MSDKRQGRWCTRVVIACRLGGGEVLGERNFVACHIEDHGNVVEPLKGFRQQNNRTKYGFCTTALEVLRMIMDLGGR